MSEQLSPPQNTQFKKQNSGKVKQVLGEDAYEELHSTELNKTNSKVIKEAKKNNSNKALEILGTDPRSQTLMKTFGLNESELSKAKQETDEIIIEKTRIKNDQTAISNFTSKKQKDKILDTLGISYSKMRLEKQLGLTPGEVDEALMEGKQCREETELEIMNSVQEPLEEENLSFPLTTSIKTSLDNSQKLQKVLGLDPKDVRLMYKLGLDEHTLKEAQNYAKSNA